MLLTPASELAARINRFQEWMKNSNVGGCLLVQNADLVYFSGTYQNAYLYIPDKNEPVFMVRRSIQRARECSPLRRILPLGSPKRLPEVLREEGFPAPGRLGLELDVLPARQYFKLKELFPGSEIVDCSTAIRQLRAIKSPYELGLLKDTADMMDRVFARIPDLLEEGITELELAGRIEGLARREGHQGMVRVRGFNTDFHYGCLLTGAHGGVASFFDGPLGGPGLNPAYPFGLGCRILGRDEPVMVDYAGCKEGYVVDMARLFVLGSLPGHLERAHRVAVQIQNALAEMACPGVSGARLYELALSMAHEAQLNNNFMGCGEQVSFVAHGVGLELDEFPVLARGVKTILQEGMVLALEPKFIFPGEGAVGIENIFVVQETGLERLTRYPDEICPVKVS
ncbi:MAG: Xaa-Pro peptidase family protein [Bacillota bacterium]